MNDTQAIVPVWAYLAVGAVPVLVTLLTLLGVVWQGRKTRRLGTEEHGLGRELLTQHGEALNRIEVKADRTLWKVDYLDDRVVRLERDGQMGRDDAKTGRDAADAGLKEAVVASTEILDRVLDHVDAPHSDIREGA